MSASVAVAITGTERAVVVTSRGDDGQQVVEKYDAAQARRLAVMMIEKAWELERVSDGWPDIEGRE